MQTRLFKDPERESTHIGDVWRCGDHVIICGDSRDPEVIWSALGGNEARLCVTSPPYGVGLEYEQKGIGPWRETVGGVINALRGRTRIICWNIADIYATGGQFIEPTGAYSVEMMRDAGFLPLYVRLWKKPGAAFQGQNPYHLVTTKPAQEYEYIFGFGKADYEQDYIAPGGIQERLRAEADKAGLTTARLAEIVPAKWMYGHWFSKHQFSMIDQENYERIQLWCDTNGIDAFRQSYSDLRRQYESINLYSKNLTDDERSAWGQWGIWEITPARKTDGHPAPYPIELPTRCIKIHTQPGDLVLDPFGGSGTTMLACEQTGRRGALVEITPKYVDIAVRRWEALTCRTAQRLTRDGLAREAP